LLKNSVERLQLGSTATCLTQSPACGGNLSFVIGHNFVVGVIEPCGCVRAFINNLVGMRSHGSHYFYIQLHLNCSLSGGTAEVIEATNRVNQLVDRCGHARCARIAIENMVCDLIIIDLEIKCLLHLGNGACSVYEQVIGCNAGNGERLAL